MTVPLLCAELKSFQSPVIGFFPFS